MAKARYNEIVAKNSDLLRAHDLAKFFGLGVKTIYHAAQKGQLPAVRIGKFWFFSKKALFRWLRTGKKEKVQIAAKAKKSEQSEEPLFRLLER